MDADVGISMDIGIDIDSDMAVSTKWGDPFCGVE